MNKMDRFKGCLLGLAVGDALGAPVEFMAPGTFEPIRDMRSGGEFKLEAGQWTDDTSLALCIAASLVETRSFDPVDQLNRYIKWYRGGYMSSTGECFDIGITTKRSLLDFEETGKPYRNENLTSRASNGALMRLAPVPMAFCNQPEAGVENSGNSARTTHNMIECVDTCRYLGALIIGALNGEDKETLLSPLYAPEPNLWIKNPLTDTVKEVVSGSFTKKQPPEIVASSGAVNCFEAALWAFYNSTSFEEGCLMSANLGDDSDTTAAIYGQLAGAYYGMGSIPGKWLDVLAEKDLLVSMSEDLFALSESVFSV